MIIDEGYNWLLQQKEDAWNRYKACQNRIEECEHMLSRLKPVKEEVSAIKAEFSSLMSRDEDILGDQGSWKGTTWGDFTACMSDVEGANNYYYINTLDACLDALNNRITEIENKKLGEFGLLGKLGSLVNSLANQIENYFN